MNDDKALIHTDLNRITATWGGEGLMRRWISEWLEHLGQLVAAGGLTSATASTYESRMRRWCAWIDGRVPTPAEVQDWVIALCDDGLKPASVGNHLAAVKAFFRWCEATGRWPAVARSVRAPREFRDGPLAALSREQAEALIDFFRNEEMASTGERGAAKQALRKSRDIALALTLLGTGLRTISLVRADVKDLDLTSSPPRLLHRPKGHRAVDEWAALPPEAAAALQRYATRRSELCGDPGPLWVGVHPRLGSRLNGASIRRIVARGMNGIGIDVKAPGNAGQWGPHCLRRTAVTIVADEAGIEEAQIVAGHASVDQTRRAYARVNKHRVQARVAPLLDFGKRRPNDGA
ncbi:MAG: tyrosine-type recombinase/integrase [Planctomycetota bacterium]|nr:tyrosine-type recombinase/integrase [Planctomycetota bacterium]